MGPSSPSLEKLAAIAENLRVEGALLPALDALGELDVVVLKGGLLTRRLYRDLSQRVSSDNDLLIRGGDAREALERLGRAGFATAPGIDPLRALARGGRVELSTGGESAVTLDLHTRAFDPRLFDEDEEWIWSALVPAEFHGRTVRMMNEALTLAHVAGHALSHGADQAHLRVLSRAFSVWAHSVDEVALRSAIDKTIGQDVFDFSILLLGPARAETELPWKASERARSACRWAQRLSWQDRSIGFRLLFIAGIKGGPQVMRLLSDAVYPGRDELLARYGDRSLPSLLAQHFTARLGQRDHGHHS